MTTITAIDYDHGGFTLLRGEFWNSESGGEAHVQSPDGSIIHLTWDNPDVVHFEQVPISGRAEDLPPAWHDEDDYLRSLLPELVDSCEKKWAVGKDPIYSNLPDLEQQWVQWKAKASQGE